MKFENPKEEEKKEPKQEKPLGYIEGSGGMLTPYYSEEERIKILEEIKNNSN